MKIVDCFMFYNELKMLEFRLEELYEHVDYFVLVECKHTHSGKAKPLFYEENKDMYKKYNNKIIHVVVEDMPNTDNSWDNENHHRRCIDRGIQKIEMTERDVITVSDLDEVPDINTILYYRDNIEGIYKLRMDMYYYNLTCKGAYWYNGTIMRYKDYIEILNRDCQKIRGYFNCRYLDKGGWHFSYFGDINFIKNKIQNFAHQEYNKEEYLHDEKLKKQIENCNDIFFREEGENPRLKYVKLEDNVYLPKNYKMVL